MYKVGRSITLEYFLCGFGRHYKDDPDLFHTDGGFKSGRGFWLGIPYTEDEAFYDRKKLGEILQRTLDEEECRRLESSMVALIYWRQMEARPIWTRFPLFIYGWAYERIFWLGEERMA